MAEQGGTEPSLGAALPVPAHVRASIEDFLYYEAELLDARSFDSWLELFAEDARYEVPLRVTREKNAEWDVSPTARIIHDSKDMLRVRIARLKTEYAWAEDPPSRTRHFLSNIRVLPSEEAREYVARYNLLVYRSRGELPRYELLSGKRRDILRETPGGWRIAYREVILDQSVLATYNLSYFV
jgi:3-phenylpropionate/cinnamic acid dioxygenase small subunit